MTSGAYSPHLADLDWKQLESILPAGNLTVTTAAAAIEGSVPARVARPASDQQVSDLLQWANAAGAKISVRGGGTKLGWGNPLVGLDLILSTENLSGIVEHAWQDMTVTVRAGTTLDVLQAELAKHRQRLALDALWSSHATVGGVIAANDSGPLRLRFGSLRDLILGITIVLPNGTIARSGGKVVKNVAGYDLPKLLTGSLGTLGIITEATFRAHPLAANVRTITFHFADVETANKFMLAIADSTLVPAGMQLRTPEQVVVDVRFEGVEQGIAAQIETTKTLVGAADCTAASEEVWQHREALFSGSPLAIVGKISVLPTAIADTVKRVRRSLPSARFIVQATGLGLLTAECGSPQQVEMSIAAIGSAIRKSGGTVTWLKLPVELKKRMDVFGPVPNAYPVMVRVKQQFDPNGILNPGRFVGGI